MNIQSTYTTDGQPQHLASLRAIDCIVPGVLPANNAAVKHSSGTTTDYGEVPNGTVMAKAADDTVHPCGLVPLTGASAGGDANVVVGATQHKAFRVGDKVSVVVDATEAKVLAAGAGGATLTVKAKRAGLSIVIAVAGNNTAFSHSFDETTDTITINSATDGGGLATTTLETIQETLLTVYGALIESAVPSNGAAVAAALASTALGYVELQVIRSGAYITAIDTTTGAVTVSGGNITAPSGALLVKELAYKPCGILKHTYSTVSYVGTTKVTSPKVVDIQYEGDFRLSKLIGISERVRHALSGAPYKDVLIGALVQPQTAGCVFRNL